MNPPPDPVVQKVLFNGAIPALIALAACGAILLRAWRNGRAGHAAVWTAPIVVAVALAANYTGQDMGTSERRHWLLAAMLAGPLAWAGACTLRPGTGRSAGFGAAVTAIAVTLLVGGLAWQSSYDDQPASLRLLPGLAAGLLAGSLNAPAVRAAGSTTRVAMAVMAAATVGVMAPVVVFTGNTSLGELLIPAAVAGGVVSAVAGVLLFTRFAEMALALAAGAVGVVLVLPPVALAAWSNPGDLPARMTLALLLAVLAPLLAWLGLMPGIRSSRWAGPIITAASVLVPLGVALYLAMTWVDVEAYQPPF